jgi:transposase
MDLLGQWRSEIANGQVRVMFLDECHLLWGDLSGYGWSRRNQRVDVEIKSTRERQTYYGALDYLTKNFVLHEYSAGNGENTIAFLKYLQSLYAPSTRFIIIWDGASYHRSDEMKAFLSEANGAAPPEEWVFHCIRLAPNAPEQNPVEDVWLQGKQLLRKFSRLCKNFKAVKVLFELFLNFQTFIFPKAFMYGYCSCPI